MGLWDKTTGAPKWAPAVRTKEGWEHAETGELLVAFADTSYVETSAGSTIKQMYLGTWGNTRQAFKVGDKIQLRVVFTEKVKVTGVPVIYMTFKSQRRALQYVDTSNKDLGSLLFEYTLTAADVAAAGEVTLGTAAVKATKTIGTGTSGLTFTAKTAGVAGNDITIEFVDPGAENATVDITVTDKAISITLAADATPDLITTAADIKTLIEATVDAAALVEVAVVTAPGDGLVAPVSATNLAGGEAAGSSTAITLPTDVTIKDFTAKQATHTFGTGNSTLVVTAQQAGTAGNSITCALVNPDTDAAPLSVAVAGTAITVNLANNTAVKATKTFGTGTSGLTLTAKTAGAAGNSISLTLVDPGAENATADITVTDTAISITLASSAAPALTSTAADIKTLIEATPAAAALVDVALVTAPGDGVMAACTVTTLAGGVTRAITTTAAQAKAAIAASTAASALVFTGFGAGDGTGALVAAVAAPLANGGDAVDAVLTYGDAAVDLTKVTVS